MKKIYIALACLCFVASAVLAVCMVGNRTEREVQQEDVEALRDQLKVYQTAEETNSPPPELPSAPESEIPVIPEAAETTETEAETTETETETTETETETTETEIAAPEETISETAVHLEDTESAEPETETESETEPMAAETVEPETEASVPEGNQEALLDFNSMWKMNPDICAWIEIDGTKVDYPILQSPTDDEKYLTTSADGSYYIGGSLFTQASYNSRDFNDPVTLIYGHTMTSGTLFGQLQTTYTSATGFAEHSDIKLYLPEEVRHYTVFAAVPYSNIHIPATYDFSKEYWFYNFFKGIFGIRELGGQFNRDIKPEYGDRVIVLSTCMNEDSTRRYLVMAINQDDIE